MGLLTKIRGLYRFDGDTEPVQVSRRQFFFVSGVVLAGAALPVAAAPAIMEWPAGPATTYTLHRATYPALVVTKVDYALGIVTFDTVYGPRGDAMADVGRTDIPARLNGAEPGDVLSPADLRRLEAIEARDYPPHERLLTITPHWTRLIDPKMRHWGMACRATRKLGRSGGIRK